MNTVQIKQKPYHLLLLTGMSLILISFFVLNHTRTIDIHLHDTYFVMAHSQFWGLLAIVVLFVWGLYILTGNILYSKTLTWAHVIITILTFAFFALTVHVTNGFLNPNPRHYDYSDLSLFEHSAKINKAVALIIGMLLIGQLIFIVNITAGLIKKRS